MRFFFYRFFNMFFRLGFFSNFFDCFRFCFFRSFGFDVFLFGNLFCMNFFFRRCFGFALFNGFGLGLRFFDRFGFRNLRFRFRNCFFSFFDMFFGRSLFMRRFFRNVFVSVDHLGIVKRGAFQCGIEIGFLDVFFFGNFDLQSSSVVLGSLVFI